MPRRPIDFKALRARLDPRRVLDLLGWQPSPRRRSGLYGPCPVHGSHHPHSISLQIRGDHVRCYRCHHTWDALGLYVAVTRSHPLDAAYHLCERLRIDPPFLDL